MKLSFIVSVLEVIYDAYLSFDKLQETNTMVVTMTTGNCSVQNTSGTFTAIVNLISIASEFYYDSFFDLSHATIVDDRLELFDLQTR